MAMEGPLPGGSGAAGRPKALPSKSPSASSSTCSAPITWDAS